MELDDMIASDMALLATASALLHYTLGFYGLVAAYVLLGLAENGGALWRELRARGFQLRSVLNGRANANDCSDDAGGGVRKALHRQPTWRVGHPRSERARSDAWTEPDDDDADDVGGDQLLETNDGNLTTNTDANSSNETNDNITVTPAERRAKQLLAKLLIRDVFASSSSSAPPSAASTASSTSSSTSAVAPPPPAPPRLVAINARAPVAFETDLFAGHALFLVRTAPEDPHYAPLFAGKRRTFWIQVQGRFKRRPRGTVFLGGELPGRISLGLFTKSVALVILGIIQSLVGKVHVSFGVGAKRTSGAAEENRAAEENTDPAEDQEELPAVAFPLYQSVDQFMVTPEGETPPPLGRDDFGESEQARARRRQTPLGRGDQVFDVGPTYSFHFHTMYVNLAQWKTANLPGLSDMHLTTFFDALPLRLVAYDVLASTSNRHLQAHKQYLFNFEVAFDAQAATTSHEDGVAAAAASPRPLWRTDSEHSFASSSESTGTAPSVATSFESTATSPCPTIGASSFAAASSEDQAAISDALATIDRENARALRAMRLEYLYWIEELDAEMGLRRVQYVFRVREQSVYDEDEDQDENSDEQRGVAAAHVTERLVVVSAYRLRLLLGSKFRKLRRLYTLQSLRFHARSRIDSYSIIGDEARDVAACLERLLALSRQEDDAFSEDNEALVRAFESALYQILTARTHLQLPHDGAALSTELTPVSIGVKLSRRDRDGRGVAHEGVVYRFYADTVARQEAMVLTATDLQFFRSQSSSPDKIVAADRVIGIQATSVPYTTNPGSSSQGDRDTCSQSSEFAFALQINTFAEEIVVCVATEHARNAWIREILQHCCPHANFDRSLQEDALVVCYTPTKALKPANRVALNSRSLFPRTNRGVPSSDHPDAVGVVTTALRSAVRVHELGEDADVMTILEFLNHASALRGVDLSGLMERPHEERLAFFLNLYHLVLAHAMIAHGFPRAKAQWGHFQAHMSYVVGRDARHAAQPLTMSLAEIEHVLLRARLPPAVDLPHLRLDQLAPDQAARLAPFGLAHPDFRVSFALLMNHSVGHHVPLFEPETVHEQLNAIVQQYVAQHLRVDRARQTIFLPRICEWFRHDFGGGGSPLYCVRKLLGFLADDAQQDALDVLDSPTLVHIKYGEFKYVARTSLRLTTVLRTSFAQTSKDVDDGADDSQTA